MESDGCWVSLTAILFFYQIELNLYSCYPLFPLCFKKLFILFIDQCFTSFSHQLFAFIFVLQRTFYFSFSSLVLSVTRSEYLSRHFQKVSSKRYRFRNNIFPLYKLKCFAMSIRWQRNFCSLEKILDFGKDFLLKNFCLKLVIVQKIKRFIQHEAFVFHDLISNSPFKVL